MSREMNLSLEILKFTSNFASGMQHIDIIVNILGWEGSKNPFYSEIKLHM